MGVEASIYGGNERIKNLGLEVVNGKLTVLDDVQNQAVLLNVYNLVKYLTMDAIQKEVIENDIIPAYMNSRPDG